MNSIFFTINNLNIKNISSNSVLQACFSASIDIPRFCYHEGLRIAGNCRMCLVEISSSKKLVASCATPLVEGLDIKTTTLRVKRARQAVLEFLLINHPLDCPICDQGGECDLQDITLIFGGDRGRFFEISKRSVFDKNLGPLIKTIMNRCIHCTRCVRFFSEINQINLLKTKTPLLGLFGRGSKTEVGTYVPQIFLNEFSGNVIDLCPVGALTSKPFSFKARAWELATAFTFDVLDNMLPRIRLDLAGVNILRVLPYADINNFTWISNKTRYYFDFLEIEQPKNSYLNLYFRKFIIKKLQINLEDSLNILTNFIFNHLNKTIQNIVGSVFSLESFFILKEFFITQGINNFSLDNWVVNKKINNISVNFIDFRETFALNFNENFLSSNLWFLLNVGLNLRIEAPLLFLHLARLIKTKQIELITFNALNYNNINKVQNQTSIALNSIFQFTEGRTIQTRFFFKFIAFYKCLVLLPEFTNHNMGINALILSIFQNFKKRMYSIFFKKYDNFIFKSDKNFFLLSVIQKYTSNLTLYEIGLPYVALNLLKHNFSGKNLLLAYDTSAFISTKLFKKINKFNWKTTSVLFSMNLFESSLLNKFNLIIPIANIYQINESFLNLFLEKRVVHKVNAKNTYDIYTIFHALTSFMFLKYHYKWKMYYNSFFFVNVFNNFKKFRNKNYFINLLNVLFFNTIWTIKDIPTILHIYLFTYTFSFLNNNFSIFYNKKQKINQYILNTNNLNFYIETRSDIFISSKTILKSSNNFKKEYNFISFSTSI